jgi:hypothetical protein
MPAKSKKKARGRAAKRHGSHVAHEAEGGAAGAIAGAAFGMIAGPPGVVAGAVVGGIAGGLAAAVLDREDSKRGSRERALDAEIGVTAGDLGAPGLEHPPARVGAYSSASAGSGTAMNGDDAPAEGPMQPPGG